MASKAKEKSKIEKSKEQAQELQEIEPRERELEIGSALAELKKQKRNFVQTVELIINLKDFDFKRENINFYVELPHKVKETKLAFISDRAIKLDTQDCDVLDWNQLQNISQKEFKKIAEKYSFFITLAKLVPELAKKFGKVLGPRKKMPDPKLGTILADFDAEKIKELAQRLKKTLKVVNDKNSIKLAIGKEDMPVKQLEENARAIMKELSTKLMGKAGIKEVLIKLTMSRPLRIKIEK
ncbi:MAG: hypothetical protein QXS07_00455 [Candidatus Pacearchaeota archaeon]